MGKAVAGMVMSFLVGTGAMSLLSGLMGAQAEAAGLGAVGISLIVGSLALGRLAGAGTAAPQDAAAARQ